MKFLLIYLLHTITSPGQTFSKPSLFSPYPRRDTEVKLFEQTPSSMSTVEMFTDGVPISDLLFPFLSPCYFLDVLPTIPWITPSHEACVKSVLDTVAVCRTELNDHILIIQLLFPFTQAYQHLWSQFTIKYTEGSAVIDAFLTLMLRALVLFSSWFLLVWHMCGNSFRCCFE